MKKNLLVSSLLVLAMLLGLLSGCGTQNTEPSVTDTTVSATDAAVSMAEPSEAPEPATSAPEESMVEASVEEAPEVLGPEAYYASEELTEISLMFQFPAFFQGFFPEGWGGSDWWTAFGEKTNTHWNLQEVSNLAWQENVNLLCASGDLPDTVCNLGSVYNGGIAAAMRDEQVVDISGLVEEYAPHYFEKLSADEYTLKCAMTDDGKMGNMYPLLKEPFPVTSGLWIRQDWLDELNMEIPTTPDELFDTLVAFRDTFGATTGFYQQIRANINQAAVEAEGIWNAFGRPNFYLDEEGTIQYGPMQDYFYDYIGFLQKLAKEGLFLTSDMTDQRSNELFATGSIGLEGDSPDNVESYIILLSEEEQQRCKLVPMAALGAPTEFAPNTTYISSDAGGMISISGNCQHPEVVLKALDYLFTDEGFILSSFGIEGEGFTYNDAGEPELTELVLNNPNGIPARAAMGYFLNPGIPGLIDYTRSQVVWDDVQRSSIEIWNSAYTGDSMTVSVDSLTLTQEEQDEIMGSLSDMVTYASEWINGVIFSGNELTDASIAEFQQTMRDTMHVEEILKVYNDAYERFEHRSFAQ